MSKNTPIIFVDESILFGDNTVYETVPYRENQTCESAFRRDLAPGSARWISGADGNKHAALSYVCPCGCGMCGCVDVKTGDKQPRAWQWDGNIDKPTLSPSILHTSGCRWHGFLRNGVFESC